MIFARPVANWLAASGLRVIEGRGDPGFYAQRLAAIAPFLAVIGVTYAALLHLVLFPRGRIGRLIVALPPWIGAMALVFVGVVFALTPRYLTGDEPHYLAMIESLWRDGDLDLSNQVAGQQVDILSHTFRVGHTDVARSIHFPGLAVLLTIPFGVGGVKTVLVAVAMLWAALARTLRPSACVEDRRAESLALWLVLVFSMPLVAFSGEIYPEVPAALLLAFAFSDIESRGKSWPLGVAVAAAGLGWLHVRFLAMALLLAVAALVRSRVGRFLPLAAFAVSVLAQGVLFDHWYGSPLPWVVYGRMAEGALGNPALGFLGIFFDQQAGLLVTAPIYLMLGPALLASWAHDRGRTVWRLALLGSYLGPVAASSSWHGFWSPSARMWVPVSPILFVLLLEYLPFLTNHLMRRITAFLGCVSLAFGFLYVALPDKRCGVLDAPGSNFFLTLLSRVTHLPFSRVVPHLQKPTPLDVASAVVELGVWLGLSVAAIRCFPAKAPRATL